MRYPLWFGVVMVILLIGLSAWWDFVFLPSCLPGAPSGHRASCPGFASTTSPLVRAPIDLVSYVKVRQNRDVLLLFCIAMGGALVWFLRGLTSVEQDYEVKHEGRSSRSVLVLAVIACSAIFVLLAVLGVLRYRWFHLYWW